MDYNLSKKEGNLNRIGVTLSVLFIKIVLARIEYLSIRISFPKGISNVENTFAFRPIIIGLFASPKRFIS